MHTCMKMWFRGVIPSKSLLNCIFVQTHPAGSVYSDERLACDYRGRPQSGASES